MKYAIMFDHNMTIVEARSPRQAVKYARETWGTAREPYSWRRASAEDLAHFESMGGHIQQA